MLDIKEIRKSKTIEQKRIFEEIEFLKIIIRIQGSFTNEILDIETGLEGRDKEL